MQVAQGSLTIVNANTPECQVYWNGTHVEGVVGLKITNTDGKQSVVIELSENEQVSEMQNAGIKIKRVK